MRTYDENQSEFLLLQQEPTMVHGAPVVIKKSPSEPRPGYLDHSELAIMKSHWIAREKQPEEKELSPAEVLQKMRDGMGFPNKNLCTVEIHTKFETIQVGENTVGLWR
ncbi:MAG: hypothetical protein RSC76_06245, partial [Oscillospiraceae bacterium]